MAVTPSDNIFCSIASQFLSKEVEVTAKFDEMESMLEESATREKWREDFLEKMKQNALARKRLLDDRFYPDLIKMAKDKNDVDEEDDSDIAVVHLNVNYRNPSRVTSSTSSHSQLFQPRRLQIGSVVFGKKSNDIWFQCQICEVRGTDLDKCVYKVTFGKSVSRDLPIRQVAYYDPPPKGMELSIGQRVIAAYREFSTSTAVNRGAHCCYYAGVIAETPSPINNFRFLVFFDDFFAQYCKQNMIRIVAFQSKPFWKDIPDPDLAKFFRSYLEKYPERPMVRMQPGQTVKVATSGKWINGRVEKVDASLVRLYFEELKQWDWMYRGSIRLYPLYRNLKGTQISTSFRGRHGRRLLHGSSQNQPVVEYSFVEDAAHPPDLAPPVMAPLLSPERGKKQVAKKSTASRNSAFANQPGSTKPQQAYPPRVNPETEGDVAKVIIPHRSDHGNNHEFSPHVCVLSDCMRTCPKPEMFRGHNPLHIPLVCGFQRNICQKRGPNRLSRINDIVYRSPCGRRLASLSQVDAYLQATNCPLTIDLFCFDPKLSVTSFFKAKARFCALPDLSFGEENVPICCVNNVDVEKPLQLEYTTQRMPKEDVNLNLDPGFLACCDCKDNCRTPERCACQQLTYYASSTLKNINNTTGYKFMRLNQTVITGIYECNPRCGCDARCGNKVVQRGLQHRLQLFKTLNKGWGVRTLDDIPDGSFICYYVGDILTEERANKDGREFGDEYLAELDHIEVVQNEKEGYEAESLDIDNVIQSDSGMNDYNDVVVIDEFECNNDIVKKPNLILNSNPDSCDEEEEICDLRKYLNDPQCYVIDAKCTGNIGRYLNHSCQPNCFVQNVFIDTHDLRFPWVAFFASRRIAAGEELTWDYAYEIGSVPNKRLLCHCGTPECRGRLL